MIDISKIVDDESAWAALKAWSAEHHQAGEFFSLRGSERIGWAVRLFTTEPEPRDCHYAEKDTFAAAVRAALEAAGEGER